MSFSVKIRQTDASLAVEMGDTILTAALAAGISYPHGCQSGNCGACKSRLYAGEVEMSPYSDYALTDEEKDSGLVLACRAVPWSDCDVAWLEPDEVVSHPLRKLDCKVAALDRVTHDITRVRLSIDTGHAHYIHSRFGAPHVVDFIKQGLVAAAANPIEYGVMIGGQRFWILPPEAKLTFLVDVAVPYVEAVFLRGMPFLGTVSYNAQAQQISPDQATFTYGALYADPLPTMGAGVPPSLLMQDMYRHLPQRLHEWYWERTRGEGDVREKICRSFQKSMFCVTNAAISGTMPHALDTTNPEEQEANRAYAASWAGRLVIGRTDCLAA